MHHDELATGQEVVHRGKGASYGKPAGVICGELGTHGGGQVERGLDLVTAGAPVAQIQQGPRVVHTGGRDARDAGEPREQRHR